MSIGSRYLDRQVNRSLGRSIAQSGVLQTLHIELILPRYICTYVCLTSLQYVPVRTGHLMQLGLALTFGTVLYVCAYSPTTDPPTDPPNDSPTDPRAQFPVLYSVSILCSIPN